VSGQERVLAVIPARGGSKGLPGKNIRPLAGLPLIVHALLLARSCPEIARVIVSTDSEEIAAVARQYGAEVPFLRPAELASDETAMWPVLQHALEEACRGGDDYDVLMLLDPTSPARLPADVTGTLALLAGRPEADGVVAVSEPHFNPLWHAVIDGGDGTMQLLNPEASTYGRRQDVPRVFRINAALYAWRTSFVRSEATSWLTGRNLLYEIPELRALHVDSLEDFTLLELYIREGLIELPWLAGAQRGRTKRE
jgi:CMP-N,N'-diacetyllegionaminic acid synthase